MIPQKCHWSESSGKAWRSDDLKPGELPSQQSPFDLRAMGRGFQYKHFAAKLRSVCYAKNRRRFSKVMFAPVLESVPHSVEQTFFCKFTEEVFYVKQC